MDRIVFQLTAYDTSMNIPEVRHYRSPLLGDLLTFLGQNLQFDTWYVVKYVRCGIFRNKYVGSLVARSVGLEGA